MFKRKVLQNNTGFTLIEILSAMVIMGVIASVGVKKFDNLSETATTNALQSGIRELRTRETVAWTKIKLSTTGYTNDAVVNDAVDKNIGHGYSWNPGPNIEGGRLHFKSLSIYLERVKSTINSPGSWN